jgi:hypothetical protein
MNLRTSISLLFALSVLFVSCKKDETEDPVTPPAGDPVSTVPSSFTQKVMLEIFTGAGQPQCTDGFVKENDIVNAFPSNAIPVRVHYSDAMEIPYYTSMETSFSNGAPPSFPSAMINRTPSLGIVMLNRSQWMSNFLAAKSKTPYCGLAIKSSVDGTTATIEVHAGFKPGQTGPYHLTVMLAEDDVRGTGNQYDQRNSYHTSPGHPYYNSGDPIVNFSHIRTLRKVLTADTGDAIPEAVSTQGGEYVKTFTVNVSAYKTADLSVIAFINKKGSTSTGHEILNAQSVKLGSNKNWD